MLNLNLSMQIWVWTFVLKFFLLQKYQTLHWNFLTPPLGAGQQHWTSFWVKGGRFRVTRVVAISASESDINFTHPVFKRLEVFERWVLIHNKVGICSRASLVVRICWGTKKKRDWEPSMYTCRAGKLRWLLRCEERLSHARIGSFTLTPPGGIRHSGMGVGWTSKRLSSTALLLWAEKN